MSFLSEIKNKIEPKQKKNKTHAQIGTCEIAFTGNNFSLSYNNYEGTKHKEGNTHDYTKGVDIKTRDNYVRNGTDNYLPFQIVDTVSRSVLQKRAYQSICAIAAGKIMFKNRDGSPVSDQRTMQLLEIYKEMGINHHQFVRPVTMSNYLFGGCPVTMSFGSNGREFDLMGVMKRDYKTMRLMVPTWDKSKYMYDKHFYHKDWGYKQEQRNKNIRVSETSTQSWLEWMRDPEKNKEKICFYYEYDPERPLTRPVNRTQSYFIKLTDELSDHYPLPGWMSGAGFNYIQAEYELSCFDIDDIENGLHAAGIVEVYSPAYNDPTGKAAKQQFEKHVDMVKNHLKRSYNSGNVIVVPKPVSADGQAMMGDKDMNFKPITTSNTRDRHEILDKRIKQNILAANSAIYAELFGIGSEHSSLSESPERLMSAIRILNQFAIRPLIRLLDDPESGFLNMINDIKGIEERVFIAPNLGAFMNIAPDLAKHFLHPDQWFDMYEDFGLSRPTIEQQQSRLIPAYISQ